MIKVLYSFAALLLLSGSVSAEPFDDFFSDGFPVMETAEQKNFSVSGYLEETYRHYTVESEALQNRQKLFMEQQYKTELIREYASVILENDFEKEYGHKLTGRLDEAYLTLDTRRLDVIAGKKMLRWGTGDGINPLDLINPRDPDNLFSTARSDSREAILLTDFIYTADRLTFELVLIPRAEVMSLPEYGNPWLDPSLKAMYEAKAAGLIDINYDDKPDGAEAAMRVYGTFGSVDLGLIYFTGYDDSPFYKRAGNIYTVEYKPMTALDINFAAGFEKSTLRGELSVKPGKYVQQTDIPEKHDYYEWVLGYDINFRNTGYLNFQLFGTYLKGDDLPSDRETRGVSFEISEKYFQDDLKTGIRSTVYFTDNSGAAELFFSYKYGDNLELTAGYMDIFGQVEDIYGRYNENDFVYVGMKYSF